eukprot:XP_001703753.1 predicted protein [Chlamydomonas reinhardtii]
MVYGVPPDAPYPPEFRDQTTGRYLHDRIDAADGAGGLSYNGESLSEEQAEVSSTTTSGREYGN